MAVCGMIDVVVPAIAVDRPIVQHTAVAIMLYGEGVAVAVVAVTVIGGADAHPDIGDIDQHARPRILRLGLRAQRNKAPPAGESHRGKPPHTSVYTTTSGGEGKSVDVHVFHGGRH